MEVNMGQRTDLIVIDPQLDFVSPKGSLYVGGADGDMDRVAALVGRMNRAFYDIHVTLDSHHFVDIAHPIFWVDANGKHPNPFTLISDEDVAKGVWRTTNPQFQVRALEYVKALKTNGRYMLCIWPPHTLIGSWGYGVWPALFDALLKWETNFAMVDYVTKGSNFWTEHYSAVQADVPDPQDPGTMLNTRLIQTLQDADRILIAGEALSHCVKHSITDVANNFGEENIKKFVLLEDASSSVQGFEKEGEEFVKTMKARGMQIARTTDF